MEDGDALASTAAGLESRPSQPARVPVTAPPAENGDGVAADDPGERAGRRPFEPDNGTAAANQQSVFREMLKHSSAQPVVMEIKNFLNSFPSAGLTRQEAANRVHAFLTKTQEWMLTESVVFAADADEEGRIKAAEGLEKFVLVKLHSRFCSTDPEDVAEDEALHRQLSGLQWVSFSNLSGPEVEPSLLALAMEQLKSIDAWKAPKDKLVCIINACKVINDVLKRSKAESGKPLAADDFLPLLIYIVIQANPPRLHSNIEFVASFRHPSRLVAEDAYYLLALQSAISFAKTAGPKELSVSAEDFEQSFAESQAECEAVEEAAAIAAAAAVMEASSKTADSLPASVPEKARSLTLEQHTHFRAQHTALPMTFEAVKSARRLKVKDVATLLDEYKEMARILRTLDAPAVAMASALGNSLRPAQSAR